MAISGEAKQNSALGRSPKAKIYAISAVGLLCLFSVWLGSSRFARRSIVEVPSGILLSDVLQNGDTRTPEGWFAIKGNRTPATRVSPKDYPKYLLYRVVAAIRGQDVPVPNPPREVDLVSNLEYCATHSGTTYLLAKEFMPQGWTNKMTSDYWLCFVYGGTNNARNYTKWVAENEAGILSNGIQVWRKRYPVSAGSVHERFRTNECAIVRDEPRVAKIVPLRMLKAYLDAGLIKLPTQEHRQANGVSKTD
jgi:hypothetical protein